MALNLTKCGVHSVKSKGNIALSWKCHVLLSVPSFLISGNTRFSPRLSTTDDSESPKAVDGYSRVVIEHGHRP